MKIAFILADGFEDSEMVVTRDLLVRAGFDVTLFGLGKKIVEGSAGIKIISDEQFSPEKLEGFDGVVLPGGRGYKYLLQSESVRKSLKEANEKKKMIAAICAAPVVLAEAGILDDVKATVYPGFEKKIPHPRNGSVVVDKNIITANGPGAAFHFGLKIIEYFLGKGSSEKIKNEMVIQ